MHDLECIYRLYHGLAYTFVPKDIICMFTNQKHLLVELLLNILLIDIIQTAVNLELSKTISQLFD